LFVFSAGAQELLEDSLDVDDFDSLEFDDFDSWEVELVLGVSNLIFLLDEDDEDFFTLMGPSASAKLVPTINIIGLKKQFPIYM